MVAIAIITGFLSGGSSAALIALISSVVSHNPTSVIPAIWGFIGLALVAAATGNADRGCPSSHNRGSPDPVSVY